MPVKSLSCPCTFGRLPLDHFSSGACKGWQGGMKMPLEWVISIVEDRVGDIYHAAGRLTTTRCLGCPRETLLADLKDYTFDPRHANSPQWGTAIHEKVSRNKSSQYFEVCFGSGEKGALPPARLFGVELAGKIDKITLGYGEIHDYKCHSESAQKFIHGKKDLTVAAQMNIYRLAIEQVVPEAKGKIHTMIAYHGAMTSARGPEPWIPAVQPFLSEQEILEVKPNGGDATVGEIVQDYADFFTRRRAGMGLDKNLQLVPLRGRTMFGGKKCTDYCQAGIKELCDGLEGIESF